MKWTYLHKLLACVLASNYFAFQVELFEEEYEANHPRPAETCTLSAPALNWESFDKENAPEAFVVDPGIEITLLFLFVQHPVADCASNPQSQPVRDKSPPSIPIHA